MSSRGILPPALGGPGSVRNPLGDVTFARRNSTIPKRGSRLRHLECADNIKEEQPHKSDGTHSPPKKKLRAPLGAIDIPNDKISPIATISKPSKASATFTIFDAEQNENPVKAVFKDKENGTTNQVADENSLQVLDDDIKNNPNAGAANQQENRRSRSRSRSRRSGRQRRKRSTSPPRRNFPTVSGISSIESVAIPDATARVIHPAPDPPTAQDYEDDHDLDNEGDDMEIDDSPVTATAPSPPYNPVLPTLGFQVTYTPEVTKILNEGIAMMEQEVLLHILGEDPESMLADRASGTSALRVLHLVNYARKRVKNEVWLRMCANGNYSLENRWNVLKSMIEGIRD